MLINTCLVQTIDPRKQFPVLFQTISLEVEESEWGAGSVRMCQQAACCHPASFQVSSTPSKVQIMPFDSCRPMDGKQHTKGDSTQASSDVLCKHIATDHPQFKKPLTSNLKNKDQNSLSCMTH